MTRRTDRMEIVALRDAFGVTIAEATGLALLARGGIVPPARIRDVYCDKPDTDPVEARQMVKRVRKKVPALKIITHWGVGYELAPESASAVRQAMRSGGS
jgi:DNA-binding response OmpR family regulator